MYPVELEFTTRILELTWREEGKVGSICIIVLRRFESGTFRIQSRITPVHDPARFYILRMLHLLVMLLGLFCPPFRTTGSPSPELSGQDEAASGGKHQYGVLRSK